MKLSSVSNDDVENRIVDLVFQIKQGNFTEFLRLLNASGISYTETEKDVYNIAGRVRATIYSGTDPVSLFVCICYALLGEFWPYIVPNGMKKLHKRWKKEKGEAKSEEETRGTIKYKRMRGYAKSWFV